MRVYLMYSRPGVVVSVAGSREAAEQDLEILRRIFPEAFYEQWSVMGETAPPEQLKVCDDILNGNRHEYIVSLGDSFIVACGLTNGRCRRYSLADAIEARRAWLESGEDERVYSEFAANRSGD